MSILKIDTFYVGAVSTPFSGTKVSQNEDDSHEQISNDGADEDNNDRENYNSTSWTSYNDDVMGEKSHKNGMIPGENWVSPKFK